MAHYQIHVNRKSIDEIEGELRYIESKCRFRSINSKEDEDIPRLITLDKLKENKDNYLFIQVYSLEFSKYFAADPTDSDFDTFYKKDGIIDKIKASPQGDKYREMAIEYANLIDERIVLGSVSEYNEKKRDVINELYSLKNRINIRTGYKYMQFLNTMCSKIQENVGFTFSQSNEKYLELCKEHDRLQKMYGKYNCRYQLFRRKMNFTPVKNREPVKKELDELELETKRIKERLDTVKKERDHTRKYNYIYEHRPIWAMEILDDILEDLKEIK